MKEYTQFAMNNAVMVQLYELVYLSPFQWIVDSELMLSKKIYHTSAFLYMLFIFTSSVFSGCYSQQNFEDNAQYIATLAELWNQDQ